MGLLDFLFRQKDTASSATELPKSKPPTPNSFEERFLTLDKPRWFGAASRSPNGRWVISWRDGGTTMPSDGPVSSAKGAWLLYEVTVGRVEGKGALIRGTDGAVANNGTFVLAEMGFASPLDSVFHAFDAEGRRILKHKLRALIMTTAVSENGRYALCTTANSPHGDGLSLFLFDLKSGEQIFATTPRAGWAKEYEIDEQRLEVIAHIKDLGSFRYDRTGQFLDQTALEEATLQRGSYSSVILTAERIIGSEPGGERVRRVLAAIQQARQCGADKDPGWKAIGLKVQGIAHEALDEVDQAMAMYEQALALDPKIGVKRRLSALQKRKIQ